MRRLAGLVAPMIIWGLFGVRWGYLRARWGYLGTTWGLDGGYLGARWGIHHQKIGFDTQGLSAIYSISTSGSRQ